jgi:hypothetical protein
MMHHLVQTLTSWRTPMKKHHIWCSLNANLQWPLGGNLDPTCIGFLSFISFSNNRTMQDSLIDHRDALLFDSKFPLVLFIPVIYLKSVTTHQFLKRRAQCRTLPVCLWNVRIWDQNLWVMMKLSIWSHHLIISRLLLLHSTDWGYGNQIPVIARPPCDINYLRLACMNRFF